MTSEMNMFGTTAKDLVDSLPEATRGILQDGLQRYIRATGEEGSPKEREQAIADLKKFRHLLSLFEGAAYQRNDRDCIAFMVAVTGQTELICAAYEMTDVHPWHQFSFHNKTDIRP